jgi:hypothetical protein
MAPRHVSSYTGGLLLQAGFYREVKEMIRRTTNRTSFYPTTRQVLL